MELAEKRRVRQRLGELIQIYFLRVPYVVEDYLGVDMRYYYHRLNFPEALLVSFSINNHLDHCREKSHKEQRHRRDQKIPLQWPN